MSKTTQAHLDDLDRSDSKNIPVNLIYPADYPNSPAIMLPEVLSPALVLDVLKRFTPEKKDEAQANDGGSNAVMLIEK